MASELTTAIFRAGSGKTLCTPMKPRNGGVNPSWPTSLGWATSAMSRMTRPASPYVEGALAYLSYGEPGLVIVDVGDVEDDQARFPVGEVGERTFHVRRPVQRDVALRFLAARQVLPRHPPAAGLDRLRRVSDVHDHVDVAAVARHSRGQMHVASARIEVAVRAGSSG